MAYSKIEKTVLEIAKEVADKNSCFVYDVEYVKEGTAKYLRIYIDRDGGVTLDDCESVSREMSDLLDEKDPIKENYVLEVASPGIERKLRQPEHFEMYMGEIVDIGLYKAIDGSKTISGVLEGFEDKAVTIAMGEEKLTLPIAGTTSIKLHFDF